MMINVIIIMQKTKKTISKGTEVLDSGIFSAIINMNTVTANMRVTATDNLSPDSAGSMNVMIVNSVMMTMGNIKFIE